MTLVIGKSGCEGKISFGASSLMVASLVLVSLPHSVATAARENVLRRFLEESKGLAGENRLEEASREVLDRI